MEAPASIRNGQLQRRHRTVNRPPPNKNCRKLSRNNSENELKGCEGHRKRGRTNQTHLKGPRGPNSEPEVFDFSSETCLQGASTAAARSEPSLDADGSKAEREDHQVEANLRREAEPTFKRPTPPQT
jgi:hypothetical protein